MVKVEGTIPPPSKIRVTEALERLVKLYEERAGEGDAEKAAKYRELLEARKAVSASSVSQPTD